MKSNPMEHTKSTPEQHHQLMTQLHHISPLGDEARQLAKPYFTPHHFKAGASLIAAGDRVREIHFITSGLVHYYYITEEGKAFNKSFAAAGDVASSILSLVSNKPAPFFVDALLDTETFSIPYPTFLALSEQHQEWNRLAIRLLERLAIKKERREADFLLLSATKRYENFLKSYPEIADAIPNYHVASYLGITEVALSRIRKQLGLT